MILHVHIRRQSDGVVRVYKDDWGDEEFYDYIWEEGNYACDCNRELFFERAAGDPGFYREDIKCGHTRFRIVGIYDERGELQWWGDA